MRWIHNTALQNSKTFAHRHATFWSLPFALAKTLALPLTETLGLAETVSQAGWWAAPEAWKRDDETLHCFFPDFADQQLDTPAEWKMCLPFLCYRYLVWGLVPFGSVYRRQQGWWDCDTVGRVFFLPKLTGIIFQVWIRQLFFFSRKPSDWSRRCPWISFVRQIPSIILGGQSSYNSSSFGSHLPDPRFMWNGGLLPKWFYMIEYTPWN